MVISKAELIPFFLFIKVNVTIKPDCIKRFFMAASFLLSMIRGIDAAVLRLYASCVLMIYRALWRAAPDGAALRCSRAVIRLLRGIKIALLSDHITLGAGFEIVADGIMVQLAPV